MLRQNDPNSLNIAPNRSNFFQPATATTTVTATAILTQPIVPQSLHCFFSIFFFFFFLPLPHFRHVTPKRSQLAQYCSKSLNFFSQCHPATATQPRTVCTQPRPPPAVPPATATATATATLGIRQEFRKLREQVRVRPEEHRDLGVAGKSGGNRVKIGLNRV
jgi:hypothetical protein